MNTTVKALAEALEELDDVYDLPVLVRIGNKVGSPSTLAVGHFTNEDGVCRVLMLTAGDDDMAEGEKTKVDYSPAAHTGILKGHA